MQNVHTADEHCLLTLSEEKSIENIMWSLLDSGNFEQIPPAAKHKRSSL